MEWREEDRGDLLHQKNALKKAGKKEKRRRRRRARRTRKGEGEREREERRGEERRREEKRREEIIDFDLFSILSSKFPDVFIL